MARTVTWEGIRELAAFEAERGCAISLYLNLDPSDSPTAGDAQTRLSSLLAEAAKAEDGPPELAHDARQALRSDIERIGRYFEQEFDRDRSHGLALFCAGLDGAWEAIALVDAVTDEIRVDRRFYLAPLVPLVGRGRGALVVVVGREQGRFYLLRGGRLEEHTDLSDEQPRRHDQGGWSQARFQRRVDNLASDHVRAVAEELDRLVRRARDTSVVVVSPEETWAEFSALLSHETRAALAGWTPAEAHAGPAELLELAEPVLERSRGERAAEIVERWREEAGRGGRAASGWAETLEAASDGRVDVLLFGNGVERPAWRCPSCGRASASAGACPLDGSPLEQVETGLDLAIHQTLVHGGTACRLDDAPDLGPVEGIAALLRY